MSECVSEFHWPFAFVVTLHHKRSIFVWESGRSHCVTLTWDLQLVAEGVGLVGAKPGGVLLQVAWLLLERSHRRHQLIYLPLEPLVLPGLQQLGPLGAEQLLHFFREILEHLQTFADIATFMIINQI